MRPILLLALIGCTQPAPPVDGADTAGEGGDDTGSTDTTPPDTGSTDTGTEDTGTEDTGTPLMELPAVLVNELMAANVGAVLDDTGAISDWIELWNAGEEAADLSGFSLTDDWTQKDRFLIPDGTVLGPGEWLVFWADGLPDLGATHLPFRLSKKGDSVGIFSPDLQTVDWVGYDDQGDDMAWARIPDGAAEWVEVLRGTPGEANREITTSSLELLPALSVWSYFDQGGDLGTAWREPDFDDSGWASGPGVLGYGDSQATVLEYGDDSNAKYATTWFRTRFTLPEGLAADLVSASLELLVDDGAIVWLNGVELTRLNMSEGEAEATTLASATVSGDSEDVYTGVEVETAALVEGENTLAVEVHQAALDSSDMSFDLSLSVEYVSDPG